MKEKNNEIVSAASGESLLQDACVIIDQAKEVAYRQVNETLIKRNWLLGMRIQHEVLKDKRAEYGEQVVKVLAKDLTTKYGEGFTWRNLYNYIDFYSTYNGLFLNENGESANVQSILHAVSAKSENIFHAVSAKSPIRLSWTHYRIILQENNKEARYIEHRGAGATPDDDREIRMEGDDAQYEEHAYGSTESPMQQQKQYDLTEMTSAVDRVRQFFWSESAMAFIFCVCRDCFNYANNMSQFEREFNCREGLLSNTFRNNPYMYLSVDKWAENGAKERVLRLVDAYKDAIKEGPLEQNRQNY